jgi:hypothetical protein
MINSPSFRVLEDGLGGLDELLEIRDERKNRAFRPPRRSGLFNRLQLELHELVKVSLHLKLLNSYSLFWEKARKQNLKSFI